MRLRLWTVLAILILWAALPASGAAYRDSDNGILGTMQREADGRVAFSRLANCLSMVMEASGIAQSELRRLSEGRRITIDERIFDPAFRPSPAVIAESKRILALDSAKPDQEAVRALERKLAEVRKAAGEREKELETKLESQRKNAAAAATNAKTIQDGLTTERDAALERAGKAEARVSEYKKNVFRELARKAFGRPEAGMAVWFLLGCAAALIFHWMWRELYLKPKNFIRPLEIRMRAEDGTKHLFTWDEEEGGYTCEECVEASKKSDNPDAMRRQGRGLKLANLRSHLDRSKIHAKFRILNNKGEDTTAA